MCSLESELESHMGEFHVKMKGEFLCYSQVTSSFGSLYLTPPVFASQAWRASPGCVPVTSMR